jgi:hypothetical protein
MNQLNQKIKHIEIPPKMRNLKISDEGYPVPWFVPYVDGKPEFRGMDGEKFGVAIRHKRCWLCGEALGKYMAFVIGPMCMVNKINSEPPCHYDCAFYAVQACPFLTQPRMRRNEKDMPEGEMAGVGIKRNPGVNVIWVTQSYHPFKAPNGILLKLGVPERVEFYSQGRAATFEEVKESIDSGLPILHSMETTEAAHAAIEKAYEEAMRMVASFALGKVENGPEASR